MSKMVEDERIKKEIRKLNRIFKDIEKDKKSLCTELIKNAAFMAITLEDLQKDIMENGAIITGTNGNGFEVVQENPAQRSYNTMINRYASIIKQLNELLPDAKEENVNKAGEKLAAFVAKGK